MRLAHCCFVLVTLVSAANLAVDGAQKYGVTVKAVQPAALAKAKTYVWTQSRATFQKNIDRMILAAVDRELAARGFTKLAAGPSDVVVTYDAIERIDLDVKAKPSTDGTLPEIPVGTLVVEMNAPANRQPLFSVRIDTPIDTDPATLEGEINAAVTAMFEKYPGSSKR